MDMDLIILCPDGAWPQALCAVLQRPESLGIRPVVFECLTDPLRDSSPQAVELLRQYVKSSRYALVVRDFHGSGWEERGMDALHRRLIEGLTDSGWNVGRAEVLIAEPELECWLRLESEHLHGLLESRATKNREGISRWKEQVREGYTLYGGLNAQGKAVQPKEVFGHVLRHYGIVPSNDLFGYLARKESLHRCEVPSFVRFVKLMQQWFPAI